MSWGPKPPITKPFYCQTFKPHIQIADYTSKPWFCQTFYVQNSVQNCTKNVQKLQKKYKKVWKNIQKPGKKVCLFVVYYTRGIGIIL